MNTLRRSLVAAFALAAVSVFAESKSAVPAAQAAFERATSLAQEKDKQIDATVAAFAEAIEADPDFMAAHEKLKDFKYAVVAQANRDPALKPRLEEMTKAIQDRYRQWEKRWPESPGIAFGIVMQLYWIEDPRARPYLLEIVKHQPNNARVWSLLSNDAERWGDDLAASEYMLKASQAEPASPDYAFYYADGLHHVAPEKWAAASRDIAKRFPTSERGAQALYWLAQRDTDDAKRIAIWEGARRDFPPAKFSWTRSSMDRLYEAYLRTTPDKAVTLAQEMAALGENGKDWAPKTEFAQAYRDASALVAAGKFSEASPLLDKLTDDRRSPNPVQTLLLKAKFTAGNGNVPAAYESLVERFAQSPMEELQPALKTYAQQLGKTDAQMKADIWAVRAARAKPAPAFDLGLYTSDQKISLASLRGKVVFVTFWFPGCGPCRGEFPHFENVVTKFKDNKDVVYLGINGVRDQDDYVTSFMAGTNYSFIPLKGEEAVTGPAGYAVRGYPANFLIDRDGRVVFSDFSASDPDSERMLQRMLESLLERPAKGS